MDTLTPDTPPGERLVGVRDNRPKPINRRRRLHTTSNTTLSSKNQHPLTSSITPNTSSDSKIESTLVYDTITTSIDNINAINGSYNSGSSGGERKGQNYDQRLLVSQSLRAHAGTAQICV